MKTCAIAFLLVPLLVLSVVHAVVGDDDVAAAKMHIEVLVHAAEALKAEGRSDAAEVLWKRAHELKERLAQRTRGAKGTPLTLEQAERVLHGLEMGMESLKVLGREKEVQALAKIAEAMRQRMHEARKAREENPEILEAKRRLEVLRLAFHGLREGEKREAMERMEHAIHVMELNLAGRRDEEAQEIRRRGPDRGETVELLQLAANLWDGFGHETKEKTIRELAEQLAAQGRQANERRPAESGGRTVHEQRLRLWQYALAAFREAEKRELVERTELLVYAHELALAGREDDEAREVRRRAPKTRQQAELAAAASHLYAGWGKEERAHALMALSHELATSDAARRERERDEAHPGPADVPAETRERMEVLQVQLHELRALVERLHEEVRHLAERLERD